MDLYIKRVIPVILLSYSYLFSFSQSPEDDLVLGVLKEMSDTTSMDDIIHLIQVVEAESVPDEVAVDVLAYLTNAYSGVGFYDTGYWGGSGNRRSYTPVYPGPLPPSSPEDFYRPVWGIITSGYGYREKFGRVHKGLDLALNIGDTVRAALPGIVTYVSYEAAGYGNYVVLAHSNGIETRYAHLSGSLVRPGQSVDAGEAIALGGNTGNSTGPHLHFETRYLGVPLDPRTMFDFSQRNFGIK